MYKCAYEVYIILYWEPEKIVLGTTREHKGFGAKRRCVEKEETMMYVPILKSLNVILQDETILVEDIKHFC